MSKTPDIAVCREKLKDCATQFKDRLGKVIRDLLETFPVELTGEVPRIERQLRGIRDEDLEAIGQYSKLLASATVFYISGLNRSMSPLNSIFEEYAPTKGADYLFNDETRKMATAGVYLFPNLKIDMWALFKSPKLTAGTKLKLNDDVWRLWSSVRGSLQHIILPSEMRERAARRKQMAQVKKEEVKKLFYEKIGSDINNPTLNLVIDELLDELDTLTDIIGANGEPDVDKVFFLAEKIYKKLVDKYKFDKEKEEDLIEGVKQVALRLMGSDRTMLHSLMGQLTGIMEKNGTLSEEGLAKMRDQKFIDDLIGPKVT